MREEILKRLKEAQSEYVSGKDLSEQLGISRTAIWKHMNVLRSEGHRIDSVTNKGYRLTRNLSILDDFEIKKYLTTAFVGRELQIFSEIYSTNTLAKLEGSKGAVEGLCIAADKQTAGRGRMGRTWNSPEGMGLYFSILLRPQIAPQKIQIVTLAASVAVVRVLKKYLVKDFGIKWPNDILVGGKKLCGILTEMSCELERIDYLVVGIGINVNTKIEDFPKELREIVTSIVIENGHNKLVERERLFAEILNEFEIWYNKIILGDSHGVILEWKKHSVTLGKIVEFDYEEKQTAGIVEDISDTGALIVRDSTGRLHYIQSGEINISA